MNDKYETNLIDGIEYYEKEGIIYLKLEAVARGLGFTTVAKSGNDVIRWNRVDKYLAELGIPTCGHDDFIPENIFYRLCMKSHSKSGLKFQAKVADEILPTIRKHGAYMTTQKIEEILLNPDAIIELATTLKAEMKKRTEIEQKLNKTEEELRTTKEILDNLDIFEDLSVAEFAIFLKKRGIKTGQRKLFKWFRENGYLGDNKEDNTYNVPTIRAMDLGLFNVVANSYTTPYGNQTVTYVPRVTVKGKKYFTDLLIKTCSN